MLVSGICRDMNISKRTVDGLVPRGKRYFVWDETLKGFGVRVEPSGRKTYLCRFRVQGGRRQYLIGTSTTLTADQARVEARRVLSAAVLGTDVAQARYVARRTLRFDELAELFLREHGAKLKPASGRDYASALHKPAIPALGRTPVDAVTVAQINRLHLSMDKHRFRANRVVTYVSCLFSWAATHGHVPKGFNPARDIKRYKEQGRERYLSSEEIKRLSQVLRQAETDGLAWTIKAEGLKARHLAKPENQREIYARQVTNAIRLLLFTGCRLREILHLRWTEVNFERGLLHLPDSKTGRKTVVLNVSALDVIADCPRVGEFVIASDRPNRPRHDLKRPWDHIRAAAGLDNVRLHDLRHTHASIGVAAGLGLPIVGKLLGHASPATTARYAHLADDPVRRASDLIGGRIAVLMGQAVDQSAYQDWGFFDTEPAKR